MRSTGCRVCAVAELPAPGWDGALDWAGRRAGLGEVAGRAGVSAGRAGSVFMMLTGGIDAADGKKMPAPRPAVASGDGPTAWAASGVFAFAGQTAE